VSARDELQAAPILAALFTAGLLRSLRRRRPNAMPFVFTLSQGFALVGALLVIPMIDVRSADDRAGHSMDQ